MTEIAGAETLRVLDALPHVELMVERTRVAVCCEPVEVLLVLDRLRPTKGKDKTKATLAAAVWAAKSARVAAVSIGGEHFNPEGATWPR